MEEKKKILIVEDELDIQELLRTYLEDAGYGTSVAGDGVAALSMFHAQPFDLVLLDLMLPGLTGEELIARMRNAGAKRVELATPVFQRLTETQIARETSVAMTFGGVEDE